MLGSYEPSQLTTLEYDWSNCSLLEEYLDKSLLTPTPLISSALDIDTLGTTFPTLPSTSNANLDYASSSIEYVAVSTAFSNVGPTALSDPPDIVLYSLPDMTLFFVHRQKLLATSSTLFNFLVAPDDYGYSEVIPLPDSAEIINSLLHLIYNYDLMPYQPTIDVLVRSFNALFAYGCGSWSLFTSDSQITQYLLQLPHVSAHDAFELYALAASHDIKPLAKTASTLTLSHSVVKDLKEDMATRMGAVYLNRLYTLHAERKERLGALMLVAPQSHPNTQVCSEEDRFPVMRAYALAAAFVAWEGFSNPSLTPAWIRGHLSSLLQGVRCELCRENMVKRIDEAIHGWEQTRCTI